MAKWNIYEDGHYVGCSEAQSPDVAFAECMIVYGLRLENSDVKPVPLDENRYKIEHEGTVYEAQFG